MMEFEVQYTESAYKDLRNIIYYISSNLNNKKSALNILNLITKGIDSLSTMPYRFPLIDKPLSKKLRDRKMTIKKYVVIYNVDKIKRIVSIIRIMNCLINTNG